MRSCCRFAYRCIAIHILTLTSTLHRFLALKVVPMLKQCVHHQLTAFSSSIHSYTTCPKHTCINFLMPIPTRPTSQRNWPGCKSECGRVIAIKQGDNIGKKPTCKRSISFRAEAVVASQSACTWLVSQKQNNMTTVMRITCLLKTDLEYHESSGASRPRHHLRACRSRECVVV